MCSSDNGLPLVGSKNLGLIKLIDDGDFVMDYKARKKLFTVRVVWGGLGSSINNEWDKRFQ